MDFSKLRRGEYVALGGAFLLIICVFLPAFHLDDSPGGNINGHAGANKTFSIFQVESIVRWLLIAAALAPIILAYIIVRDHKLSWPRGELTAVIGIAAFGFVLYNGLIDRPGEPSGATAIRIGWIGALIGTMLMVAGGSMRAGESERRRKPPGVI